VHHAVVPAGLDGHVDPIRTAARDAVLDHVAQLVAGPGRVCVGVDGRPGAGKSTFADEVAARVALAGRPVVRSTTDSFHRPRAERLARGSHSADGYVLDSHQLDAIVDQLLVPFARGATRVRVAAFDEPADRTVDVHADVPPDAVLVFDGLFLHRPELAPHWHATVLLTADARLDAAWMSYLLDGLPAGATDRASELDRRLHRARWPRYRDGWRHYVEGNDPAAAATVVVDNEDLAAPQLLRT
jgi:uridine kinase